MKTNIKIDSKSALMAAIKLLPTGGLIELTPDPTSGGWNATVKPTADRSTPVVAPQPPQPTTTVADAKTEPAKMTMKAKITAAISLPASATAAEIYAALKKAPRGSSADFLIRALGGERVGGRSRVSEVVQLFSAISDADAVEDALNEGLDQGSSLIDSAFCAALDNDAEKRRLVDDEGRPARRWGIDEFGEPFHLDALMQDKPFAPPFTGELVTRLNDLWLSEPISSALRDSSTPRASSTS